MSLMLPLRYFLYPFVAVVIWSVNTIVTKMAAGIIEPTAISFYRWFLAWLLLTPFIWRSLVRDWAKIRPLCPRLAVLGFLAMVLNQDLGYIAANTTSATNMGIIVSMMPVLTIGCAAWILRERPTRMMLAGAALSLLGLFILIAQGEPARLLTQGIRVGDGLMLVAVFAYALYGVLLRHWAIPLSLWLSLYMQIVFGVLFQLPLFLLYPASPLTPESMSMILYAAVFASLFGPLLWIRGVQLLGPSRATLFMNLMPVLTAAIAIVFLKEELHFYHVVGGALALAGVLVAQGLPHRHSGRSRPVS
ncbi:MAG: DMT family transporter [Candidimonas sp.]|nr:MAG: DMT family transporter [Candidimonas sp.]TAM22064.1 MAG: DMT family transporter [Candidimonas sp.]TAM74873.1 MAG: DMT family transporter [Candidimonas sp.]